jgi:hypothetical protein
MLLLATVVAGCGIPPDDHATLAQPGSVPYDLLGDGPPATAIPQVSTLTEKATIFLVQGERLAPVPLG